MSSPRTSTSSKNSGRSLKSWAKEHHAAMNGAFDLYRGGPRLSHSTKPSKNASITTYDLSSNESLASEQPLSKSRSSGLGQTWQEIKTMAKEHHQAVNAAHRAYYGLGAYRAQAVKEMGLRGPQ